MKTSYNTLCYVFQALWDLSYKKMILVMVRNQYLLISLYPHFICYMLPLLVSTWVYTWYCLILLCSVFILISFTIFAAPIYKSVCGLKSTLQNATNNFWFKTILWLKIFLPLLNSTTKYIPIEKRSFPWLIVFVNTQKFLTYL